LNITGQNSGAFTALLSLGMSAYDASLVFKSPIVSQLKTVTSFYYKSAAEDLVESYLNKLPKSVQQRFDDASSDPEAGFTDYIENFLNNDIVLSRKELETLNKNQVMGEPINENDFKAILKTFLLMENARKIGKDIAMLS
jgi:hypothetical protein